MTSVEDKLTYMKNFLKIDMDGIGKEKYKEIYTTVNVPDSNVFEHYVSVDRDKFLVGMSSLSMNNLTKNIVWEKFFPFGLIMPISRVRKQGIEIKDNHGNLIKDLLDPQEDWNKSGIICDDMVPQISVDYTCKPVAFIKNYHKIGLGTIAHIQILEQMKELHNEKIQDYNVKHDWTTDARARQLQAMNLVAEEKSFLYRYFWFMGHKKKFNEYYNLSKEYAQKKNLI